MVAILLVTIEHARGYEPVRAGDRGCGIRGGLEDVGHLGVGAVNGQIQRFAFILPAQRVVVEASASDMVRLSRAARL
jgi:hypothetical protein